MNEDHDPPVTEQLETSECWALVRRAAIGRVAVVRDGEPDIFPVNHVVDHGTVVFRTGPGRLLNATLHHDVAFEIDGHDPETAQAWSVVLHGWATEGRQIPDIVQTWSLPLSPWQPGDKPRVVRIEPTAVTGRRFTVVKQHQPMTQTTR